MTAPKPLAPLTRAEWRLMWSVWELGSATPPQAAEHFRQCFCQKVGAKTTGIYLARLEEKGYLGSAPGKAVRGRPPRVYTPLVSYDEALRQQFDKFLADHLLDEEGRETLRSILVAIGSISTSG